jgi:hypothetical protein
LRNANNTNLFPVQFFQQYQQLCLQGLQLLCLQGLQLLCLQLLCLLLLCLLLLLLLLLRYKVLERLGKSKKDALRLVCEEALKNKYVLISLPTLCDGPLINLRKWRGLETDWKENEKFFLKGKTSGLNGIAQDNLC